MDRKSSNVWKKILGKEIQSHTTPTKSYTVCQTEDGYECTCPDWTFRRGSWMILYKENGRFKEIRGCKHIKDYLNMMKYQATAAKIHR